jgi:hypothetical protein
VVSNDFNCLLPKIKLMAQTKEERLALIREAAAKHEEATLLALGTIPVTREDILEEASDLDAFREHELDLNSERGLTSDER